MSLQQGIHSLPFLLTQHPPHSTTTVQKPYNPVMQNQHTCASIESSHKCESWRLNPFSSTPLNGQVASCPLAIDCLQCHNLFTWWRDQVRATPLPSHASPNLLALEAITYVIHQNTWTPLLQGHNLTLQHQGHESKYELQLYPSTKGMNWGPKPPHPPAPSGSHHGKWRAIRPS